jgi:hypothetical protein
MELFDCRDRPGPSPTYLAVGRMSQARFSRVSSSVMSISWPRPHSGASMASADCTSTRWSPRTHGQRVRFGGRQAGFVGLGNLCGEVDDSFEGSGDHASSQPAISLPLCEGVDGAAARSADRRSTRKRGTAAGVGVQAGSGCAVGVATPSTCAAWTTSAWSETPFDRCPNFARLRWCSTIDAQENGLAAGRARRGPVVASRRCCSSC